MTLDMYQENVLDHHAHPRNKGRIEGADLSARERNPLCGDEIEVFLALRADGRIADAKFEGQGCAISQAAISMLTGEVRGKTLDELEHMTGDDIRELVGVPLSPARLKCALLSIQAMHRALADYKMRQLGHVPQTGAAEAADHVHTPYCNH